MAKHPKIPIHNTEGAVVGVAGITRSLKRVAPSVARFAASGPAVDAMMNHYDEPLTMTGLAHLVHLSLSGALQPNRTLTGIR